MFTRAFTSLCFLIGAALPAAWADKADELPDQGQPVLRVEAEGPAGYVTALAFSPDGKTLYAAGYDKVVRVWRLGAGGQFELDAAATFRIPIGPGILGVINAMAVSPDGNYLAVGGKGVTREGSGFGKRGVLYPKKGMSDEQRKDEGVIYRIKLQDRSVVALRGHRGPVFALAFAPARPGKPMILASAASDWDKSSLEYTGGVRLWDADKGELVGEMPQKLPDPFKVNARPTMAVEATGDQPTDLQVAIASMDGSLRVWDVAAGAVRDAKDGKLNNTVAFLPDSQILTGSAGTLRLWDGRPGQPLQPDEQRQAKFEIGGKLLYPWAMTPCSSRADGNLDLLAVVLATPPGIRYRLRLLDVKQQFGSEFKGDTLLWDSDRRIPVVAASPRGRHVAVAGRKETHEIRVYAIDDLRLGPAKPQILRGIGTSFQYVKFVQNGDRLGLLLNEQPEAEDAVRSPRPNDLLFELKDRRLSSELGGWKPAVPAANGYSFQAPADKQGHRRLVTVRRGNQVVGEIRLSPEQDLDCCALLPDVFGVPVAAVAYHERGESYLYLYNGKTGEPIRWLTGHNESIHSLAFSPDGQLLASAAEDQTVCLWTLANLNKTLNRHGFLRGIAVEERDGKIIVAEVTESQLSPANRGLLRAGDTLEGTVDDGGLKPFKKAWDVYAAYLLVKPGEKRTLQVRDKAGQVRKVDVVIGQATDEHKPLLSLFVTNKDVPRGRQWVGWSPFGFYEASGPDAERYISWHFNTNDPRQPATSAGVAQYRQKLYQNGLVEDLVALKSLDAFLAKLDAQQMPRPEMTLTVDDVLPDPTKRDEAGHVLVRQPPRSLKLTIDRCKDYSSLGDVRWWVNGEQPQIFPQPIDRELTADLEKLNLKPGVYNFRAEVVTRERKPQTFRQEFTVRYQPPAPEIELTAKPTNYVFANRFTLQGQVRAGTPGRGFRLTVYQPRQGARPAWQETSTNGDPLAIKVDLELQPGENPVQVVAMNLGAPPGYESFERAEKAFTVTYAKPDVPRVVLLKYRTLTDPARPGPEADVQPGQPLIVSLPRVRVKGKITAEKQELSEATWREVGKPSKALSRFKPWKEFEFEEDLVLDPGVPTAFRFEAKTADSETGGSELAVEYRPPLPDLALEPPAKTQLVEGQDKPEITLRGQLTAPTDAVRFESEVLVNGQKVEARPQIKDGTWTATVPIGPFDNRIQVRLENRWEKRLYPAEPLLVQYLRPPSFEQLEPPPSSKDQLMDLVAQVRSRLPLTEESLRALVGGQPVDVSKVLVANKGKDLWEVRIGGLPLQKGVNLVRLLVSNAEGTCLKPAEFKVRYEPKREPILPVVEFVNLPKESQVTDPDMIVRFRIKSPTALREAELVRDGPAVKRWPIDVSGLKPDAQGWFEMTQKIDLEPGPRNRLRVNARNEDGSVVEPQVALVNYLRLPVRLVVEGLQVRGGDGTLIKAVSGADGRVTFAAVPPGEVDLVGRVVWHKPPEDSQGKQAATRVYVNGFQQLPAELEPVPGNDRERQFRVPIILNRDKDNVIEVVLPEKLPIRQENLNKYYVDCASPQQGQRLHVLIIAPTEQDEQRLKDRVQRALRFTITDEGAVAPRIFQSYKLYKVLTSYHVTQRAINTELYLIQEQIKQLKKSDLRTAGKPLNDVVIIYFQGGEAITREDHYLKTGRGQDDRQAAEFGVSIDDVKQMMSRMPAATLLLMDVIRSTPPRDVRPASGRDKVAQWPDSARSGVIRTVWGGVPDKMPAEAKLIPALESAISRERLLGEVLNFLNGKFTQVSARYPTLLEFDGRPGGLQDLVVGVGP
jgi:WD40 repeat protein